MPLQVAEVSLVFGVGFVGSRACLPAGAGTVLAQDISKSPLMKRRGQ